MASPSQIDAVLAKAINAHQAGQIQDAQALYRAALKKVPKHPVALHFLGISQIQAGDAENGIELVRQALKRDPNYIEAHYNLACALQALGRLAEAAEHYNKVLAIDPNNPHANNNFGAVLLEQRLFAKAINYFEKALTTNPINSQTHNNIGIAFTEIDQYDLAIRHFEQSLAIKPDSAEVLCNLGNALEKSNRHEEALAIYDKVALLQPDNADAICGRGNALTSLGQRRDALAAFERALVLNSSLAEAWLGKGNVLSQLNLEAALDSYGKAVALKPSLAEAWRGCGHVYETLARYPDAVDAYDQALAYKPSLKYVKGQRLFARMRNCDWNAIQSDASGLLAELTDGRPVASPFIVSILSQSPAEQYLYTQQYVSREYPPSNKPLWQGERYSHDRIRVAYVTADFREHATSRLIAGVFEHHDRTRFETVAISFGPDDGSGMRSRLTKAFDQFIDARAKSDVEIATLIRDLEIDIAVDLMGFTSGERFNVFARRPAPVQVNYLAYPGSLGAGYIDYIIADEIVIPRDQRQFYAEKVAYLPHSYQANDAARFYPGAASTRQAVGLPETGFVFCNFNNSYKITPDVFDVWMRLLQQVDGSVLWLLERSLSASQNLRSQAEQRGVSPQRVIFAPHTRLEDHLARQRLADVFLDTLPCNAHTTASEALWVGLPVLTCPGYTFVGRVAASLLTAIGLPEQIVYSMREYEDRALQLARDPALLATVKSKLAQNRVRHPLFDTARFTRDIETLYIAMSQRSQNGWPPIALPDDDA